MIAWLTRSIGRKLLASFVAICFLTYLLTALFVYTNVRASMTRAEVQSLAHLANQKHGLVSGSLSGVATNLRAWSQLELMNDVISGDVDKRVARALAGLKRQYGLAGAIYAFDAQGKLVAGSEPRAATAAGALPSLWNNAGAALRLTDKHRDPFGRGELVALSTTMRASFAPDFVMGTLVVTVPWDSIERMLAEDAHRVVLYTDERQSLLSAGAAATVSAAEVARLARRPDELRLGGVRYIAGYSAAHDALLNDWHVAALKDADVADAPISAVAIKLIGLGLLLIIPMALAIGWLSRKLTAPVASLTRVVSGITRSGDLSGRVDIDSDDELGTLARTFNTMAENLQRSAQEREAFVAQLELLNKTLERRVHERTEALESANGELTGAIDRLKATQGQLVQAEKMASLGQLVAGVAHELNNPISFIYANFPHLEEYAGELIELIEALRDLPLGPAEKAAVERMIAAADLDFIKDDVVKIIRSGKSGAARIKEIVSSLRSFSRLDEAELKGVLLEDGIADTLAILHHRVKHGIDVQTDFRLNLPVMCRAGQINQVFMNILYNAIQAIGQRGTLRISTEAVDDCAVVRIADDGPGIPADIIGKVFDPFFTTKKVGDGTGLGLSISYGIIEQHGGRLSVASQAGHGAEFTIRLPLQAVAANQAGKERT